MKFYLFTYNSLQAFGWFVTNLCILGSCTWSNRIVPSGVLFPLMQWGGITHFLLAIVRQIDEVQDLPAVFITFFAWSLTELIRYTSFIVLYPMGLYPVEMWLMYQALPFVKEKNLYGNFFAILPFSYYNFLNVVLIYPFLWLKLYLHLFKHRR